MKVLIWIVCIFVACFLKAIIFGDHSMGFLPTFLYFTVFLAIAKILCSKWDDHRTKREQDTNQQESNSRSKQENGTTSLQSPITNSLENVQTSAENYTTLHEDQFESEADTLPVQITIESDSSGESNDSPQIEPYGIIETTHEESCLLVDQENKSGESEESIPLKDEGEIFNNAVNVETRLPPIRFCLKCGFELLPGSAFCSKCGTRIHRE